MNASATLPRARQVDLTYICFLRVVDIPHSLRPPNQFGLIVLHLGKLITGDKCSKKEHDKKKDSEALQCTGMRPQTHHYPSPGGSITLMGPI